MISLSKIKEIFVTRATPGQTDFWDTFSSFWHKSERLPQTQVLGLNDALNGKASKEELKNVVSGFNPLGTLPNLAAIKALSTSKKGDTWKAADTDIWWKYNGENDQPYDADNWIEIDVLPSDVAKAGGTNKTLLQVDKEAQGKWQLTVAFTDGLALLSANGNTTSNASYSTSDFVATKKGDVFQYTGNIGNTAYAKYVFYDENKQPIYIENSAGAVTDLEIIIPEGVAYVRFSGHVENVTVGHVSVVIILNAEDLTKQSIFENFETSTTKEMTALRDKWKYNISLINGIVLLAASGASANNSLYASSDFEAVKPGDIFYYYGRVGNTTVYSNAVFYDENKNKIDVLGFGAGSNYVIIIPDGVAYVRFCGYVSDETYGAVTVFRYGNTSDFVDTSTYNAEVKQITDETNRLKDSLFTKVAYMPDNGYLGSSGQVVWSVSAYNYQVTDFIPIVPKDKIIYTGTTGASTYGVWFYDANKTPLTYGVGNAVSLVDAEIITPEGTAFCRISGRGNSPLIVQIISSVAATIADLNVAVQKLLSGAGSDRFAGQTAAIVGDSVSASFAQAEIIVAAEDVGRPFKCYITGYDVADWTATGNPKPQKNKKIHSCIIPAEMVGKVLSLTITAEDVGLTLGGTTIQSANIGSDMDFTLIPADLNKQVYGVKITEPMMGIEFTFIASNDNVGLVLGEPRGYAPNNNPYNGVWFNIMANALGMEITGGASWSGSTVTRLAAGTANVCANAWHPQTIRKCGKRDLQTGERISADNIFVYRVINDWSKNTYSHITDFDPYKNLYPDDDFVGGSTTQYDYKKGLCKTVQEIRKQHPHANIYLCTTFHNKYRGGVVEGDPENPLSLPFPPTNGQYYILEYNKAVREVADAYGCKVVNFDKCGITYENLLEYADDGVHPSTGTGHTLMGNQSIWDVMNS